MKLLVALLDSGFPQMKSINETERECKFRKCVFASLLFLILFISGPSVQINRT